MTILGRLNGIYAEPGTIIGIHRLNLRYLAVDDVWVEEFGEEGSQGLTVRYATDEEVSNIDHHEPRSYMEHRALWRQPTVYGMVRQNLSSTEWKGIISSPLPRRISNET